MNKYTKLVQELKKKYDPVRAKHSQRFFKTGKGEYGEGDVFLGLNMPEQREIAKKYLDLPLNDIQKLVDSKIHEHRMVGLLIVTYKYAKGDDKEKEKLFKFYVKNSKQVNNWDLVDVTCHKVVGDYLLDKDRKLLYKWARSKNLWEKRLAIISTFAFFRREELDDSYKIATMLLHDQHDLIHKAVGWTLRECGKRDLSRLYKFLDQHTRTMPRTALRYAIEKLPDAKRKYYLQLT